jgi:CDP-glycerol glycerophosphotransferase (TagB/SpsB family)
VRVGRPQLDLQFPPSLPETTRKTVIYAPTWEGENEFNNYTSIDRYGVAIVRALLAQPGLRVIYRPHPRVATSTTPEIIGGHRQVMELLNAAAVADPGAGHAIAMDGSILALFQHCDAMVTDVSSVGLDFLYLRTDKPIFLTDRRDDRAELAEDAPISAAADVIDSSTVAAFGGVVSARLADDVLAGARQEMRRFYFGDLAPGESTQRFLDAVSDVVAERDALVARLSHPQAHAAGAAAAAGDMSGDDDYASGGRENGGRDGEDQAAREAVADEELEAEPAQGR